MTSKRACTQRFFSLFLVCCMVPVVGCGGSGGSAQAPTGNDLQQYLAEHPELNDAVEPADPTVDDVK